MPVKPIQSKDELDRFYTKPELATELVKLLPSGVYWVEPSAGSGAFSSTLNCMAYDLDPQHPSILKQDWFDYVHEGGEVWGVVGNPPFGRANKLSKAFIRHAINQGAAWIAFVLPDTYNKFTTQVVFPAEWKLMTNHKLPDNSFLLDGKEYHVPCHFQIWTNTEVSINLRKTVGVTYCNEFEFKPEGEWFMFGAAPTKIIHRSEVSTKNRGYYFSLTSDLDIDNIISVMKNIPWKEEAMSSVNGGVSWFTREEIINIWRKHGKQ
jgi:hypothetical protein